MQLLGAAVLQVRRRPRRRRGAADAARRHLEVVLAEDVGTVHAELVALGQRRLARRAREAVHVEHQLPGAHHQLRG